MKTISLLLIFLCAAVIAFSQPLLRLRIGYNGANISVTGKGGVNQANMLSSYQAGFIADFKLSGNVYVQPGILYTGKGSTVQKGLVGSNGYFKQTFHPFYLELPINIVGKISVTDKIKVFAGAGPYLAVGIRGKTTTEGQTLLGAAYKVESDILFSSDNPNTIEETLPGFANIKRFDYGINAIAGLETGILAFTINYGYGLAKLQAGTNNTKNDNNKHRVWSLGVGFKI